ncbi:hypothetical protein [Anaerophaga thermohalophila]|jgi:hypothetical protein|uniref:hypothetical protein n=1 Tax=Anaerophaga thermohalophila TaxID=177400 RepID=UPI00035F752A|nr:hypothetical protein [Anaerophaga thermohalophila]
MDKINIISRFLKENVPVYFSNNLLFEKEETEKGLNICFSTKKRTRRICFRFIEKKVTGEEINLFLINIQKFPFKTANDSMFLDEYLKKMKVINEENFSLNNFNGEFENRLKSFFQYLHEIIDNYAADVLFGDKWENMPINWDPYK